MREAFGALLDRLLSAPDVLLYLLLGLMAALENIVPPVPADVVVLFGAVLAGRGAINPWAVFLTVWLFNVAGALLVYSLGRRYGPGFFAGRLGRLILRPGQLSALGRFYARYGLLVIFVSRFLPMFRAVVPPFAGIAGTGAWRAGVPIAAASALWYGMIVYLGTVFGQHWEAILEALGDAGRWLSGVAALAAAVVAYWWWRTRHHHPGGEA